MTEKNVVTLSVQVILQLEPFSFFTIGRNKKNAPTNEPRMDPPSFSDFHEVKNCQRLFARKT